MANGSNVPVPRPAASVTDSAARPDAWREARVERVKRRRAEAGTTPERALRTNALAG
jgi:hypothetical protein